MHIEPDGPDNYAIERFESMLKTNQILFFDSEEFEDIAHFYLQNGKISLAKKAIKLGLEQHPFSSNLKLYQVEILIIEDKLEEAELLIDEVFYLEQGNEEVFIQKANIFSRREKHEEAISCLQQALEITSEPGEILTMLGMEFMYMEDYENAISKFEESLNYEEEDDYAALYNIVYCYECLSRPLDAIAFLNNYLETNPYSEIGWLELGKLYTKEKEYDKALTAFDFAIISDDLFLGAYLEKGHLLEYIGRYDEAIENYSYTLAIDAPSAHVFDRIGGCHAKAGRKKLALDFYQRAIEDDPMFSPAWNSLVDFYIHENNYPKAQEYVESAIAIEAENASYWKRYAKIHNHLKNAEEAEIGYRKALELGNYELDCWLKRGDLLMELGNYSDAVSNFKEALDFYPKNPEIEYRLSGLYFSLKEAEKGELHLRNALVSEPEFLIIIEELFPLVYRMKKVKQIVAQHKNPCS